ncbi:MAG: hypothetical protein ACR2P3_09200 [Geminicoccaceae bacterium]
MTDASNLNPNIIPKMNICPVKNCGGRRIFRHGADSELARLIAKAWGNRNRCPIDQCKDCGNIWEPWEDDDPGQDLRDNHTRSPCDNCAYRKGSKESADPVAWQWLKSLTTLAAASFRHGEKLNWFCCHKGIPIAVGDNAIRFDFEAANIDPRQQACAGFNRIVNKQKWANLINRDR